MATMLLTLLLACVTGVAQFGYLYQKKQVDFYHSLPIRRQKCFLVRFVNGMLMYILPYILFCLVGIAVLCTFGYGQMAIVRSAFLGFLINSAGYLLCYATAILAVCLTGNLFTGICGIATFLGYGSAAVVFAHSMMSEYSETYMAEYEKLQELCNFVSPLGAYYKLSDIMREKGSLPLVLWLIGCIIAGVILTLIAFWVYLNRKSESAGKSIAFEKSKGIIKAFVMVLILLWGTWFFRSMGYNSAFIWSAIGFVITFVLAQIMIQIIFEMDVKAVRLGRKSAIVSGMIAIAIFAGFYVGGRYYDSCQIDWERMEYAAVYADIVNGYMDSYYDVEEERYINCEEYTFEHMKVNDKELIRNLTKACHDSGNKQGDRVSVDLKYTLKNGKEVYRAYKIDHQVLKDYILQLFDDKEYRMGTMQIFGINPDKVSQVKYCTEWPEYQTKSLNMTREEMTDLIEIYKEEYLNATVDELNQNAPVMGFVLGTKEKDVEWDLATAYVYPSFEKTIAVLESKGMEMRTMEDADITEMTVTWWRETGERVMDSVEVTYTEPEKIQELKKSICFSDFAYCTAFDPDYTLKQDYSILLELKNENGGISQESATFIKEVPEWLQEDLKNMEIQQEVEETVE